MPEHPTQSERDALIAELAALESGPRDDGLGDMLKAKLVEQIEYRLDEIETHVPPVHICKPRDTTRTLCERPASMEVAIDYWQYGLACGPFCGTCEEAAKTLNATEVDRA